MSNLDMRNFTRRTTPRLPFAEVAAHVLPGWSISLVFAGTQRAQTLNKQLRNKDYIPNVLSYEVGTKSGEIIICLERVDVEAPAYCLLPTAYCLFLFIHGLLHLKGMAHGATMEKRERETLSLFIRLTKKGWHDASRPASISARTTRKSSWSKK